jgi:hypothetical protein
MALYDWDGDGKNDMVDDLIEYDLYQEHEREQAETGKPSSKKTNRHTSGTDGKKDGISRGEWICVAVILGLLIWFLLSR